MCHFFYSTPWSLLECHFSHHRRNRLSMLYGRYLDWNTMLTFGDVINMKGQSDEYILQVLAANYPSLDYQNVPARKLRKKINGMCEQLRKKTSFGLQTKYLNRKWVWNVVSPKRPPSSPWCLESRTPPPLPSQGSLRYRRNTISASPRSPIRVSCSSLVTIAPPVFGVLEL